MSIKLRTGLFLLFTVVIIFSVIFFLKFRQSGKENFQEGIEILDHSLKNNKFDTFKQKCYVLIKQKLDLNEYKRILNRVNRFSFQTGNYELFEKVAKSAYDRFKKDDEISAIYIYTLLKTGKRETARSIETNYHTLAEEAALSGRKSGNVYDSFFLESLYKRTGDYGFLTDSIITELRSGNGNNASRLAEKLPEDYSGKNLLLFYSYFEDKKYIKALFLLDRYDLGFKIGRMSLYSADLDMYLEDYNSAENTYLRIIKTIPDFSRIPYVNLAWIGIDGKKENFDKYLESGIKYFSNDRVFSNNITAYYVANRNNGKALEYIDKYCSKKPLLRLEALRLKGAVEPGRMISGIQEILLQNPQDNQIGKYYCQFLYKTGNYALLREYISKNEMYGELSSWLKFYKGLILAGDSQYEDSIELLKNSYNVEKDWELLYDMGIIYEAEKNYRKAVEMFQSCEHNVSNTDKSMIRTSLAQVLYKSGNKKRAKKEVSYALDLDNNNIKAVLLLNKLESELK